MLKAVLLDVDGTLLRSNDAHAQAWSRALNAYGYEVGVDTIRGWIGMGGDKVLQQVDPKLSDERDPGKAIGESRQRLFLREFVTHLQPTAGARALVERLGEEKLLRVVATSAKEAELKALLKAAGIEDQIDAATTSDDVKNSKPDPDIVTQALRKASCRPDEAILLGDTPYDITAAHRAGVRVIAVTCGGWDRASLGQAEAVYDDPAAVLAHCSSRGIAALVER